MQSLKGQLLIASHELRDPNFAESVVLLVHHNDEGAFGLILNRRTDVPVRVAWAQVSESVCGTDELLHLGGPVEGPLMAIHSRPILSEKEVLPGVFFSAQPENVRQLVERGDGQVRFFVGFAGWGPGQLEDELEEDSWVTLPSAAEHIFTIDANLWQRVLKQATAPSIAAMLNIKHVPTDPTVN